MVDGMEPRSSQGSIVTDITTSDISGIYIRIMISGLENSQQLRHPDMAVLYCVGIYTKGDMMQVMFRHAGMQTAISDLPPLSSKGSSC